LLFDAKIIACLAKIVKVESFFVWDDHHKLILASCSQNLETAIQTDFESAKKMKRFFRRGRIYGGFSSSGGDIINFSKCSQEVYHERDRKILKLIRNHSA